MGYLYQIVSLYAGLMEKADWNNPERCLSDAVRLQ